jgi:hypothetical protein
MIFAAMSVILLTQAQEDIDDDRDSERPSDHPKAGA